MSLVRVACVRLRCNSNCNSRHLSCQLIQPELVPPVQLKLGPLPPPPLDSRPDSKAANDGKIDEFNSRDVVATRRGRRRGDEGVEWEDLREKRKKKERNMKQQIYENARFYLKYNNIFRVDGFTLRYTT